jgi:hypothetical protein
MRQIDVGFLGVLGYSVRASHNFSSETRQSWGGLPVEDPYYGGRCSARGAVIARRLRGHGSSIGTRPR